jgi:hypothetical protein
MADIDAELNAVGKELDKVRYACENRLRRVTTNILAG